MRSILNSAVLRQNPVQGTALFAVLYFALSFALDWFFRWTIGDNPMPPLWTVLITIGIGTAISSVAVYLLLSFTRHQQQALEELNHDARNSLQILSYAIPDCDGDTRPEAEAAIAGMSDALRRASQKLGMVSEKELRPNRD